MVDAFVLLAFIPAALALNLTPGADMMFVLAQGMKGGARAGMAANFGIALGCVFHVFVAGIGLAAVVQAWPLAFEVIRWTGVAYLLYLAAKSWNAPPPHAAKVENSSLVRVFYDALLVNIFNPKVALFILAFVPQFIDPAASVLGQFAIFGGVITLGGLLVNGAVALLSGRLRLWLLENQTAARRMNRICASLFAALALRLAVTERA